MLAHDVHHVGGVPRLQVAPRARHQLLLRGGGFRLRGGGFRLRGVEFRLRGGSLVKRRRPEGLSTDYRPRIELYSA
eukprot:2400666-Pyramimonas_sp.AAC.2